MESVPKHIPDSFYSALIRNDFGFLVKLIADLNWFMVIWFIVRFRWFTSKIEIFHLAVQKVLYLRVEWSMSLLSRGFNASTRPKISDYLIFPTTLLRNEISAFHSRLNWTAWCPLHICFTSQLFEGRKQLLPTLRNELAYSGEREHRFRFIVNTWFLNASRSSFLTQVFTITQLSHYFSHPAPYSASICK